MKKYPFLSIFLILIFFVLLSLSVIWQRSEKEEMETGQKIEEKKNLIPETSVQEKKAQFKSTIVPAVNKVYTDLMQRYQEVLELTQIAGNSEQLSALRQEYKATDNDELLMALKPHPQSIALAQAAMESSWATSRFFREANNVFGIWSFRENEPRIPAGKTRADKVIWLKKYSSVEASIRDYYRTLARGDAYSEFRILKMETNDPYALIQKLDRYSEKGAEYGEELSAIIRFNNFVAYDQQQLKL